MPFVIMPGITGKIYVPEDNTVCEKKHKCKDCFSCQMCGDERCQLCREAKRSEKSSNWLAALPPLEPIELDGNPVVMILDGVSPDVWMDALEHLDAGPEKNSWSRLEAAPETPVAMSALFGFAGDPYDEFPVRGIEYFQIKGNKEHALSNLLPDFGKDTPTVIRVSLVDEGAHSTFLRLAEMPEAVAAFLNAAFPYLKDKCVRQNKKLILTADHGLSITKNGLRHGKGGVVFVPCKKDLEFFEMIDVVRAETRRLPRPRQTAQALPWPEETFLFHRPKSGFPRVLRSCPGCRKNRRRNIRPGTRRFVPVPGCFRRH